MPRIPVSAAVLRAPGEPLSIETLHLDEPRHGEVMVRTVAAGLCHSDLHYLTGSLDISLPAVLGHEVSGVVEQCGPGVDRVRVGDRVVVTITPSCGQCPECVSGAPTRCSRVGERRRRSEPLLTDGAGAPVTSLGAIGAFAEAIVVPEAALAVVDADIRPDVAALLGCCISTGVGAVIHGAGVGPTDTVAVIGCGGVGMAAIQAARLSGARRIVAIDLHDEKLALAKSLGATDTVLSASGDVREAVLELIPGGVSHVFEAVGRPSTAELAFALLAPGGVATLLGLMPTGSRISLDAAAIVEGDRRVQGSYMGGNRFLADVLTLTDHYRHGRLDLDAMVTGTVALEGIDGGFAAMAAPSSIRTVTSFGEGTW
ncbi:zinc-binding dehydrogenase [Microbacterium thalassium]|uniref:Alcohol dehydrogenase/S-(Hydroxymethyl)glutathione dehydrogenase/alcohol dehydrogenase n=1 Tax=Microbacterium thalassium TaxID=362649 RepID=A0A7X0FM02_9MICO|nr:zinc-binding dehydrogenase [Microbacterium thalassium]MBB6389964.1 alcohol dehydrogenase/S-(hydroxymethyl)glutathione dehydrogenase/alcohol dehydrogenase [Microbacterium thalassium]GLK24650.1 alcohol dehydrogenase [Microbacterium thalassium]